MPMKKSLRFIVLWVVVMMWQVFMVSAQTPSASPTSFSPTVEPSIAPTVIPITIAKSSLVLGIGAGTFTIIVLGVALSIVWCLSAGCDREAKCSSRILSALIFTVTFLALVFSPRDDKYKDTSTTLSESSQELYDSSVNTRIGIAVVTVFFSFVATFGLCFHFQEHHQLSNMVYDERAFWQDF